MKRFCIPHPFCKKGAHIWLINCADILSLKSDAAYTLGLMASALHPAFQAGSFTLTPLIENPGSKSENFPQCNVGGFFLWLDEING